MDSVKKIQQARLALLFDHPFWGYLAISLGDPIEDKSLNPPTMGTDGVHLYYHPDFVNQTPLGQLLTVIAHEVCHPMLNHITRRQTRDPMKWNIAADVAANEILLQEPSYDKSVNFEFPEGVLTAKMFKQYGDFSNQPAEYIYSRLPDPPPGKTVYVTMDDHGQWKICDENGEGEGEGKDSVPGNMEQQWREKVAQAAIRAQLAGKYPSAIKQMVEGLLNPKLDWRLILRDTIVSCARSDFAMMPPNKKHLYRGIYLPSITGESINIGLAIDTSGSISDELLKQFMSEVKGICDQYDDYTVHVFTCDAAVHEAYTLEPLESFPTLVSGRGGTDYRPAMEAMLKLGDITAIVYLTDGFPNDGWPKEPGLPVVWVLSENHGEPPYGIKIIIPNS